ncbi:MAG: hypothetical protein ACI8UO_000795, partial [Verrucomicrobiales bacterium]
MMKVMPGLLSDADRPGSGGVKAANYGRPEG